MATDAPKNAFLCDAFEMTDLSVCDVCLLKTHHTHTEAAYHRARPEPYQLNNAIGSLPID